MPNLIQGKNVDLVQKVLKRYNNAIESLDVSGTERFFTTDSKIYESGSRKVVIPITRSIIFNQS